MSERLAELEALLPDLERGYYRLALVVGRAGAGKTRQQGTLAALRGAVPQP